MVGSYSELADDIACDAQLVTEFPMESCKGPNSNEDHPSAPPAARRALQSAAKQRRTAFVLSAEDRAALRALLADENASVRYTRRIRVVLLAGQGVSGVEIAARLALSVGQVSRIRQRFLQRGVAGLADSPHLGRHDHAVPAQAVTQVTTLATSPPPAGRKRWSTRLIAAQVGLSSATVAKILRTVPKQPALAEAPGEARAEAPVEDT